MEIIGLGRVLAEHRLENIKLDILAGVIRAQSFQDKVDRSLDRFFSFNVFTELSSCKFQQWLQVQRKIILDHAA